MKNVNDITNNTLDVVSAAVVPPSACLLNNKIKIIIDNIETITKISICFGVLFIALNVIISFRGSFKFFTFVLIFSNVDCGGDGVADDSGGADGSYDFGVLFNSNVVDGNLSAIIITLDIHLVKSYRFVIKVGNRQTCVLYQIV